LAGSSAYIGELAMVAILLIVFVILLFAALPTWPYSASGRARYHVVRAVKRPRFSSGEAPHATAEDYASRFRALQNELQNALDRPANGSPQRLRLGEADRFANGRERQAA
jgi:hypothetical protein